MGFQTNISKTPQRRQEEASMKQKRLVAYFSASGVTRRVAETLAKAADADLFEICPEVPYTDADLNWMDKKSRSTIEMKDPGARPAIRGRVADMESYQTVFLGFPVWWYEAPRIISTFLEQYDFSGKQIVLFCTSGGSGLGDTESKLRSLCSETTVWLPGRRLSAGNSEDMLREWVNTLKG